jgi:hypothetical protein
VLERIRHVWFTLIGIVVYFDLKMAYLLCIILVKLKLVLSKTFVAGYDYIFWCQLTGSLYFLNFLS